MDQNSRKLHDKQNRNISMDGTRSHREQALHIKSWCLQFFNNNVGNRIKRASLQEHLRDKSFLRRVTQVTPTSNSQRHPITLDKTDETLLGQGPHKTSWFLINSPLTHSNETLMMKTFMINIFLLIIQYFVPNFNNQRLNYINLSRFDKFKIQEPSSAITIKRKIMMRSKTKSK